MSSSSTSLLVERKVDVYLSFSGEISLAIDFNYHLSQHGIKTFISDSWKEKRCRVLDQRILEALAESKVAVVMMSEKQASSVGFLEELVAILQVQEESSLIVIPIFITNNHLDVEEISQHYLGPHEEMYPWKAPLWRKALTKLKNIAAQCSLSTDHSGVGGLNRIKNIADDIWLMFLSSSLSNFKGLVGIDRQMKEFHELLALESIKDVRIVGIWGKAGVGKTTLARYTYDKISVSFQTHVFLENVENIKEKFLSGKFVADDLTSLDHERHEITEAMRRHQRILLIVDGVDNIEQGKWIAENANWFGPGSRVVIVCLKKNLLVESGVNHVYEVESLRYDEALELFSQFAFKQPYHPPDFEQLAVRAVHLAGFLPFALKLFGLFLTGKGQHEWEAVLLKLNAKHGKDIMEVWKIMEASEDKIEDASKTKTE
ncbi:PREDICTED: putative disease resistance protein At4g11170 [Camelina sativa]|uniref:Disease resistance protein At4g11170 n=1 Tax=Camelina sativa TaxID=90675 RepID=A0ABM0WVV9_CAMSA|nr:PREDICTED: putative disease resistance protein At4g11170 [Camelina sativa]